jgi:hypothetical protein
VSPEKKKRQIVRRQTVSQEKKDNSAKSLNFKKRKELDSTETLLGQKTDCEPGKRKKTVQMI